MKYHLPTCHHANGGGKVYSDDGELLAQCRCFCVCPDDGGDRPLPDQEARDNFNREAMRRRLSSHDD